MTRYDILSMNVKELYVFDAIEDRTTQYKGSELTVYTLIRREKINYKILPKSYQPTAIPAGLRSLLGGFS